MYPPHELSRYSRIVALVEQRQEVARLECTTANIVGEAYQCIDLWLREWYSYMSRDAISGLLRISLEQVVGLLCGDTLLELHWFTAIAGATMYHVAYGYRAISCGVVVERETNA